MNEIKKIISKVFLLIIDIFLFGYKIAKQVILPNRRKKGNILSSLFIFFIGIIERLDSFEYGVFLMANVLKRKYVKQSLLVIAGLLFLLSSIEWTGETNVNTNPGNFIAQFSDAGVKKIIVSNHGEAVSYSATTYLDRQYPTYKIIPHSSFPFSSSVKTFLLIRSIRI
ncbi:MAG TPA: hypothetical protein VIL78_01285 [Hanamia sp.]